MPKIHQNSQKYNKIQDCKSRFKSDLIFMPNLVFVKKDCHNSKISPIFPFQ